MDLTRRDALRVLGAGSVAAAAKDAQAAPPAPAPVPIVTSGGLRLYPAIAAATPQPIPAGTWTFPDAVCVGLDTVKTTTAFQDYRNTPVHGVFTRVYHQWVTKALKAQQLDGTISAAIHCLEGHRKLDAVLAMQVVVHGAQPPRVALALSKDANEFSLGTLRTRALVNWPLISTSCDEGDVIAINVGIWANNQTRQLAQIIGLSLSVDSQLTDIQHFDTDAAGNTWVEFSNGLLFKP
ncbi:MAG: hypothetical protein ACT4QD_20980 [Acidobacteriota bacterium]